VSTNDQVARSEQPTAAEALPEGGASRRRFAKAASLGAGGVIMTLASQRGMATAICASPSQSLSKWQSGHPGQTRKCAGLSPGYWKQTGHSWPLGLDRTTLKFSDVFYAPDSYAAILLATILDPQDYDTNKVAMHLAATWLNVRANLIDFLTEQDVQNIWHEYATTLQYKPTAGVTWSGADLVTYLQGTMS
jgi:hypothetical protein